MPRRRRDFDPAEHPRWPRGTPIAGDAGGGRFRDDGIPGSALIDALIPNGDLTPGASAAWAARASSQIDQRRGGHDHEGTARDLARRIQTPGAPMVTVWHEGMGEWLSAHHGAVVGDQVIFEYNLPGGTGTIGDPAVHRDTPMQWREGTQPTTPLRRVNETMAGAGGEYEEGVSVSPAIYVAREAEHGGVEIHGRDGGWTRVVSADTVAVPGSPTAQIEVTFHVADDDEPIIMDELGAVAWRVAPSEADRMTARVERNEYNQAVLNAAQMHDNPDGFWYNADIAQLADRAREAVIVSDYSEVDRQVDEIRRLIDLGYPVPHQGTLPPLPGGQRPTSGSDLTTRPGLPAWLRDEPQGHGSIWSDPSTITPAQLYGQVNTMTANRTLRVRDRSTGQMQTVDQIELIGDDTYRFHFRDASMYMTLEGSQPVEYQERPGDLPLGDAYRPTTTGTPRGPVSRGYGSSGDSFPPGFAELVQRNEEYNREVFAQAKALQERLADQGDSNSDDGERLRDLIETYQEARTNPFDPESIHNAAEDMARELSDYDIDVWGGEIPDRPDPMVQSRYAQTVSRTTAQELLDRHRNGERIELLSDVTGEWNLVTSAAPYSDEDVTFYTENDNNVDINLEEFLDWRPFTGAGTTPAQRQPLAENMVPDPEPGGLPYGVTGLGEFLEQNRNDYDSRVSQVGELAVRERIKQMVELDDTSGSGMKMVAEYVSAYGGTAEVQGMIVDADGFRQGRWSLKMGVDNEGNSYVDQSFMEIPAHLQGGGLAARWAAQLQTQYRENKLKYVTVHADIDVGGYAWAKAGFDFKNPEAGRRMVGDLDHVVGLGGEFMTSGSRLEHNLDNISPETRAELAALVERARAGEHITPLEIALVGWAQRDRDGLTAPDTGGDRRIEMWLGKAFLLGSDWYGKAML